MYIERIIEKELEEWRVLDDKKPLLIRGARQVGKSSTIKHFGQKFSNFVEVNFDENEVYADFFERHITPLEVCQQISAFLNKPIVPGKTLLFFDEIQLCPRAISSLRYFYEQMPDLHVIATGSLLEFALSDLPSFGVGRIRSLFMFPFSFNEFLGATGNNNYVTLIQQSTAAMPVFDAVHQKLIELFKKYIVIGGMPKAITTYVKTNDFRAVQRVLTDIVNSYNADFEKYKARIPAFRISSVLTEVVKRIGGKFSFADLTQTYNHGQISEVLNLLRMAGIIYPAIHSSATGLPLGAGLNYKKIKYLIFDTGIYLNILGLNLGEILLRNNVDFVNKGSLAELFVGIEILKHSSQDRYPELYYWHREARNADAEIDYLIQLHDTLWPIEVKAGKAGTMKSMALFLKEKPWKKGIKIALENFEESETLRTIPLYAVGNVFMEQDTF